MSVVPDKVELLACPRDRSPLELRNDTLVCRDGHEFPTVDGAPVLVHPDLAPMQLGYWATPEEVERARDHRPAPAEPPFVTLGGAVADGQPIGMIEVMKTFSHVLYRASGTLPKRARLTRWIAADGADVKSGDALFELERAD